MIILPSAARNTPSMPSAAGNAPSMARIAILAASLAICAQLAASLAALFRQHQLDNTKVIKEFQVSRLKIKTICITGGFGAHAISLRLRVALMYIDCFTTHLQNLYIIQTQF